MTTPNDEICGQLVAVSASPPEMTECDLPAGHDAGCVPHAKRQVSYNQEAVLCWFCTKRIRLNNNGKLRVHISGKIGSERCLGSDEKPMTSAAIGAANIQTAEPIPETSIQKDALGQPLFSDQQQ